MIAMMMMSVVLGAPDDAAPARRDLFGNEAWYKAQAGRVQAFEGTLRHAPRAPGVVGFGRFNAYKLEMPAGKPNVREVYVGGKDDLLKPYIGKKVKITGKAVDMEVEGTMHKEIWPARIETAETPDEEKPRPIDGVEVKVLGRAPWRASAKPGAAAQQLVVRSREEFDKLISAGNDPKTVLDNLQQQLKTEIDWSKHMLVVCTGGAQRTGGYRVEVQVVYTKGETMTVRWKLHVPKPGSFVTMAFTHPAETVLVEKFAGTVVFDPAMAKPEPKDK